jgi:hypothetical protein
MLCVYKLFQSGADDSVMICVNVADLDLVGSETILLGPDPGQDWDPDLLP